jgi:hypothetical protein
MVEEESERSRRLRTVEIRGVHLSHTHVTRARSVSLYALLSRDCMQGRVIARLSFRYSLIFFSQ